MIECDVCIVGAGIAGASLGGLLAPDRRVVLIEQESHPGYHTTGRSVAIFTEAVAGAQVTPLTRASRGFFERPPSGFSEAALMRPRAVITFAGPDQRESLDAEFAALSPDSGRRRLDAAEIRALAPILRPQEAVAGVLDQGAFDIDVDALHQGWLRAFRGAGGRLLASAPLSEAVWNGEVWRLRAGEDEITARVLVNAAGAWGDVVAGLCGVRPVGLEPRRRTVAVLAADGWDVGGWPMCVAADHSLYFKPDAGRLLVSAMDQTPSPPCDAYADDMDVAEALDRFETLTSLPLTRPLRTWAGLRTFAPDGEPVAGFDPDHPGFFWLAGQGGAGIQTSPALAQAAGALVRGEPLPDALLRVGVSAAGLDPARFRA
jgi:D-arginine dehydrogenase